MICPELGWHLTARFGLPLEATTTQTGEGTVFRIRPVGVDRWEGFSILTTVGWHSVQSVVEFGSFAGELMAATAHADEAQRARFRIFSAGARENGAKVELTLDDAQVDDLSPESWPDGWSRLGLRLLRAPVDTADGSPKVTLALAECWSEPTTGMIMSLLPLEETDSGRDVSVHGLPEGAVTRVLVNRYERSPVNRALCLAKHGTVCRVCGFDFGRTFGPLGKGFIEVHHVVPLSEMGSDYSLDPIADLVPLCPNCHSMAHRRREPFSVEELIRLLETGSSAQHAQAPRAKAPDSDEGDDE